MMHYGWPDIIILVSVVVSAMRGWKIGFINELAGTIAIFVAIYAAVTYSGEWDPFIGYWTRLPPDSSHVFALFLFALSAYGIIAIVAFFLNRYSTTPIVSPINAFGGSILGAAKAFFLYWIILYVALFLPLSRNLRNDLRDSFIVPILTGQNRQVDQHIRPMTPWFARPVVNPYLRRHQL